MACASLARSPQRKQTTTCRSSGAGASANDACSGRCSAQISGTKAPGHTTSYRSAGQKRSLGRRKGARWLSERATSASSLCTQRDAPVGQDDLDGVAEPKAGDGGTLVQGQGGLEQQPRALRRGSGGLSCRVVWQLKGTRASPRGRASP